MSYGPRVYKTENGNKLVVASGGQVDIESGGTISVAGVDCTANLSGGGAIEGADTRVLFFDGADNPAGDAGLTYDKTTDVLSAGGLAVNGHVVSLAGALTKAGAHALTLTTTGATNVTLPTSGTLATTAQAVNYTWVHTLSRNHTELKALPATASVEIAAAPGAGFAWIVQRAFFKLTMVTAYTVPDSAFMAISAGNNYATGFFPVEASAAGNLSGHWSAGPALPTGGGDYTGELLHPNVYANAPITIGGGGSAWTDGAEGNSALITVLSYKLNTTTGLLVAAS